jgi:hypothetical protein
MSTELATRPELLPEAVENVLVNGDLGKLSTPQRLEFYRARCDAAGLDPRGRPFEYISLQGKLTLYARKECAEQLNGMHGISHKILSRTYDKDAGLYEVMVEASMRDGRTTQEIGVVFTTGKKGEDLANAQMKAVTKAKRRATLSLCGLGDVADETELETIRDVRQVSPTGNPLPINNGSGHGSGKYASDEDTAVYLKAMESYIDKRNQQWLDRWSEKTTDIRDLCNRWQADGHLAKWAEQCGMISPGSVPEGGLKNAQVGRLTAIIYCGALEDRKRLAKELEAYIDKQEQIALVKLQKDHPELFEPTDMQGDMSDDDVLGDFGGTE